MRWAAVEQNLHRAADGAVTLKPCRPSGKKVIGTIGPKMNELPTVLPNVRTIRP
jgi:hypothetical protein